MNMKVFLALLKKEFIEQYRTYRLLIAVVVFLILGISGPVIAWLTPSLLSGLGNGIKIVLPPQTNVDALQSYLKGIIEMAPLVVVLLAMGCVAEERVRGTTVTVLTKPVSRCSLCWPNSVPMRSSSCSV